MNFSALYAKVTTTFFCRFRLVFALSCPFFRQALLPWLSAPKSEICAFYGFCLYRLLRMVSVNFERLRGYANLSHLSFFSPQILQLKKLQDFFMPVKIPIILCFPLQSNPVFTLSNQTDNLVFNYMILTNSDKNKASFEAQGNQILGAFWY